MSHIDVKAWKYLNGEGHRWNQWYMDENSQNKLIQMNQVNTWRQNKLKIAHGDSTVKSDTYHAFIYLLKQLTYNPSSM